MSNNLFNHYQIKLKKRDKSVEINFIDQKNDYHNSDDIDMTHLDVANFILKI